MKKRVQKLALHRETLVQLTKNDLGYVAGGYTNPPICDFSNRNTCTTCNFTCNTNLC